MKRISIALILLSAFAAMVDFAQDEPAKSRQPNPPMRGMWMMHGQMGPAGMPMGLPNLTPEQKTKLQDLRLAHQKEMLPIQSQLQKLQADLKLELTADKANEGKVKSLQGEISKLTSDLGGKKFAHMRALRDVLTPDQKRIFDERIISGKMGPQGQRGPGAMMGRGGMKGRGGAMGQRGMMGRGGMGRGKGGPPACPNCPMK